jgi:4-amino-4-deoxy-L-arabinose transferase-like glycosyltransferase
VRTEVTEPSPRCAPLPRLWVVLAAVAAVALVLRVWSLTHGLPSLVQPDEPVIVDRAEEILRGHLPDQYDWPTGGMLLLAIVLRGLRVFGIALTGSESVYIAGRVLFATIAVALVVATGLLAASVADPGRRRGTAIIASLLCALGFIVVRLGRMIQPDELQCLLVVAALACAVRVLRRPSVVFAALGGAAAGAAAGVKYTGGVAVVIVAVSCLLVDDEWRSRVRLVLATVAGFVVGAVVTLPALVTDPTAVIDGIRFQFSHQSGGHLGYDGSTPAIGTDLFRLLPGNWGWVVTAFALGGVIAVAVRGTREQRLLCAYALLVLALIGSSVVTLPHYVLPAVPALAVLAAVCVQRLAAVAVGETRGELLAVVVICVALVPTVLNDVRLVRAEGATDTRTVADEVLAQLEPGRRVIKERYTDTSSGNVGSGAPSSIGFVPDLRTCGCYVVTSSYEEERYRLDPDRFRTLVDAYDFVRTHGRVVTVIAPSRPLRYNWDTLPTFGLDTIPLTGPVGLVGPTITVYDLSSA